MLFLTCSAVGVTNRQEYEGNIRTNYGFLQTPLLAAERSSEGHIKHMKHGVDTVHINNITG